jgi:hypothetical protein
MWFPIFVADDPSKYIQDMIKNVVSGKAAISPPHLSLRWAISLTATTTKAVTITFENKNSIAPPRLNQYPQ